MLKILLEEHAQFIRDMEEVGLSNKLRPYQGRYYWLGPAVVVNDLQEALGATKVPCTWDNLGLGYIVYPRRSCNESEYASIEEALAPYDEEDW